MSYSACKSSGGEDGELTLVCSNVEVTDDPDRCSLSGEESSNEMGSRENGRRKVR